MLLGSQPLYVYGNIFVGNNSQIGDVVNKTMIIICSELCSISGSGLYNLGALWKLDPMDFIGNTTLTISSETIVNYNGTADQIFIKNEDSNSNFNIVVNGTINCATGTSGNNGYISFDGSNGAGANNCGGSLRVNVGGTVNVGQIFLMNNNSNASNATSLSIYGTVNCRMLTLNNSGAAGSSLRIYSGGTLNNIVGGSFGSLNNNVTLDNGSTVIYSNNGDQTILSLGTYYYLILDGINGPITRTLAGNISVNGKLTLKGTTSINPAGFTITYGSNASLEYIGQTHTTSNAEWPLVLDKNILINSSGKVTLNGSKTAFSGSVTFSQGELDMAAYILSGTGSFVMSGATKIYSSHSNGVGTTGNFQLSGVQTFSTQGSYEYYSTLDHQYSGNLLPSSVANITLNNTKYAGQIFLSNNVTITNTLIRKRGELKLNGNTLTYGSSASLIYENGITALETGEEFLNTMNGAVTLKGTGTISLNANRTLNNTLTINTNCKLWLPGDRTFLVDNVINNGTIEGDVRSKIYFGGETFSNGSSSLIDPNEFIFSRTGSQFITGLSKFHNSVSTTVNSGSVVNIGDGELLSVNSGGPTFTIQNGGRVNISGIVTFTGGGTINNYGTLYINSLATFIVNGMRLNVYNNQIGGSDGTLKFIGTNAIEAVNGGNFSGGSINLVINSGTTSISGNANNNITFNSGVTVSAGALFNIAGWLDAIFNSDVVNNGTIAADVHAIFNFKGSNITNTGNINVESMYFNNNGTQAVHGLVGINVSQQIKVKGMTELTLSNAYATPEKQILTIGASATFTIETDAELVIDGEITITGALGCSSIANQVCGVFTKNGTLTINLSKILKLTCGTVNINNSPVIGSGTLGIGQETTPNGYLDETNLYFTSGMSINSATITCEFLAGSCTNVWSNVLYTDGPVIVSGILRSGIDCDHKKIGFIFSGNVTINPGGFIGGVSCVNGSDLASQPALYKGNIANNSSEYLNAKLNGTVQQSAKGNFSELTIDNSMGCLLNGNANISSTLYLTNGNINTGTNVIIIGKDASNLGAINRTSGSVIGNVKRWFNSVTANNIFFPVGTENKYRPANISFTAAPTHSGTLTIAFVQSNPGANGLPLNESGVQIPSCAVDGFWRVTIGDALEGGTYNLDLTASGFSGVTDYTLLRVLKRDNSSSPWTLTGVHSNGTGSNSEPIVHRTGLTSFSEFGIGGEFIDKINSSITIKSGWNMLSVPLILDDMNSSSIFPTTESKLYKYFNGYVESSTFEKGVGYWLKFSSGFTNVVNGKVYSDKKITLQAGWNIISVYEKNIPLNKIVGNPIDIVQSNFYGYDNGYYVPDTLKTGKGYWVKAKTNGYLEPANENIIAVAKKTEHLIDEQYSITISNSIGDSKTLYLTEYVINNYNTIPPAPPSGIFDVRWESESIVEQLTAMGKDLLISSAEYPVILTVANIDLRIKDKFGGKFVNTILSKGQTLTITNPAISVLEVSAIELPNSYELLQNYPNPFNPTTEIGYRIAEAGRVTLKVYDILGREVATLVDEVQQPGTYNCEFKVKNGDLSSGIYFYVLRSGNFNSVKKLILMK